MTRAVYPGTFDPFTPGHFDVADRARRLFDHLTILVAVNGDKRPSRSAAERAERIAGWENVTVASWHGLTVDYCRLHDCGVIVRGVRNATDYQRECELATMNEALGVATLFLPASPELVAMSSTAVRATPPPSAPASRAPGSRGSGGNGRPAA
ncbi:pantetheine-phosphate adenylyltransferase [Actinoplanes sp. NPDC023714]|uniref:pantetheine-phosphate adenylyltransferase n=1 Tax=Actinoplanes sp. NPDC023714 TaxID=3154322 RepID=UPI0033E16CB0